MHAKTLGFQHDSRGERESTPLSHIALSRSRLNHSRAPPGLNSSMAHSPLSVHAEDRACAANRRIDRSCATIGGMTVCGRCGAEIPGDARFCQACGVPFADEEASEALRQPRHAERIDNRRPEKLQRIRQPRQCDQADGEDLRGGGG